MCTTCIDMGTVRVISIVENSWPIVHFSTVHLAMAHDYDLVLISKSLPEATCNSRAMFFCQLR